MNITQAAVDAAAKALLPAFSSEVRYPCAGIAMQYVTQSLYAALPHIREQIAREIEAEGRAFADRQRERDLAEGIWDGTGTSSANEQACHQVTNWAARIVREGTSQSATGKDTQ